MTPVLAISIPSPPERHDKRLLNDIGRLVRRFDRAPGARAVWFERANKPGWSLRVVASGEADWLEREARPALAHAIDLAPGTSRFIELESDDKWTGGLRLAERLGGFHHVDTLACLDAIVADARTELGSRARFSMQVVEGLLDALGSEGEARLGFYRESFAWAIERGRWDQDVVASLEQTFAHQRDLLAAMIEPGDDASGLGRWPSAAAARIGRELIVRIGHWAATAAAPWELAIHAAHSHSNRLGIHGGREAALRYLVWRARGGRPLALA
jgi:hypothetical protein